MSDYSPYRPRAQGSSLARGIIVAVLVLVAFICLIAFVGGPGPDAGTPTENLIEPAPAVPAN